MEATGSSPVDLVNGRVTQAEWLFSFISSSHQAQNRNSFSVPYAEPLLHYVGEICIVALLPAVSEGHVQVRLRHVVVIGGYGLPA